MLEAFDHIIRMDHQETSCKGKSWAWPCPFGDKQENYTRDGSVSFTVEEVVTPFKASINHVGAIALPYFAVFGASFQATDEEINQSAQEYIRYIHKYQSELIEAFIATPDDCM
ncbi:NAD(P)H-dependent oxidoreductase [Paenibacillus sp. UMB7766-LJ446]|uniref:NAD(P)H-dependent oxidoreductase n=1 Tax=Paenibacillus sp. UMB7766-LJ446 TaxID=3046313 RepID=UPI0033130094